MWFKYGLKAQKLLAQGVWGLLAKLELLFFRQKYFPYSNPHISFSILMADSERNT